MNTKFVIEVYELKTQKFAKFFLEYNKILLFRPMFHIQKSMKPLSSFSVVEIQFKIFVPKCCLKTKWTTDNFLLHNFLWCHLNDSVPHYLCVWQYGVS